MLVNLVGLVLLPRPQQQRDDEDAEDTAEMQDGQPEILVGGVLQAEILGALLMLGFKITTACTRHLYDICLFDATFRF